MKRRFNSLKLRPADLALMTIVLLLAVGVGYQYGLNRQDEASSTNSVANNFGEEQVAEGVSENTEEVTKESSSEETITKQEQAEITQKTEEAPTDKPVEDKPKTNYVGISAQASDDGSVISASSDLGSIYEGSCHFIFKNPDADKVYKIVEIVNQSTCSTSIPQANFGKLGTWDYSVYFVSSDKTIEGSSDVKQITIN